MSDSTAPAGSSIGGSDASERAVELGTMPAESLQTIQPARAPTISVSEDDSEPIPETAADTIVTIHDLDDYAEVEIANSATAAAASMGSTKMQPQTGPGSASLHPGSATANASGGGGAGTADSELESDPDYLKYLRLLHNKWTDCPTVTINYAHLSYTIAMEKKKKEIITIPRALFNVATAVPRMLWEMTAMGSKAASENITQFNALHKAAGCIAPSTMTLVLAPPGHGKTTLLKAIAGRLYGQAGFTGSLMYNGMSPAECRARGIHVSRLCAYVGQQDFTFPTLTVKETLQFAATNSTPVIETLTTDKSDADLIDFDHRRADLLINMLGMKECKDTLVGNDLLRGISGGQKRRVALAEMLLTNARVYCLDEVSTGLDAAVTKYIFEQLKEAAKITKAAVVTALLQPTPETYALFDDVILLRDGVVVYHGPRAEVDDWLRECCGFRRPEGIDVAQFVLDVLSDPVQAHHTQIEMAKLGSSPGRTVAMQQRKISSGDQQQNQQLFDKERESKDLDKQEKEELKTQSLQHSIVSQKQQIHDTNRPRSESHSEGRLRNLAHVLSFRGHEADWYPSSNAIVSPHAVGRGASSSTLSAPMPPPAIDTDSMHFNYKHSRWYARSLLRNAREMNDSEELDAKNWSEYTKLRFGGKYSHSLWRHAAYCLVRQFLVIARNRTMVRPRMVQAVVMGFILGTLFYQLDSSDYADKVGLILYCVMFAAFSNLTEIPVASEAKSVVGKQMDAGFFPPLAYTISVILVHVPVTLAEVCLFSPIIYFTPSFTYDGGRFFFFLLILLATSTCMSVMFRAISYAAKNPDVARQLDLPVIIIFLIFGGFLLPYSAVPRWLIWVYYISPFSWSVRSLALNEFKASRFDSVGADGVRLGDVYLQAFDFFTDDIWKWMGFVYLIGFFLVFAGCCVFILSYMHPVTALGTRRRPITLRRLREAKHNFVFGADGHMIVNETFRSTVKQAPTKAKAVPAEPAQQSLALNIKRQTSEMKSTIPFTPAAISWQNLNYTVFVGKHQQAKQLLHSVNGFALPGEMTALMGASGAGKTTLMDVIAGRKTTGKIDGHIVVNGEKVSTQVFQRLMGYVEQNDIHMGTQTVKEALHFSAKLRLPSSVSESQRETFVNEVMELVGLTKIAERMIGDDALPGLSTGQLKLVTIAVELVANPSILFLDEPTSGLDAPAALRVMRAVRNIAGTGRTVVCTIHQPSAQLFYMFDRLLLLRSGGRTVYFSKIGRKARALVQYFQSLDQAIPPCPMHINPANWMLDVIGAAGDSQFDFDFADRWEQSALAETARVELESAAKTATVSTVSELKAGASKSLQYLGWSARYWEVQKRLYVSHWRNPPMNATRILLMFTLGLMFGVIYYNIGEGSYSSLQAKLSVLILGMVFPGSVSAQSSMPSLFRQRPVYYRELTAGMYNPMAWSTALMLVEMPFIALGLVFFIMPFYFMAGFAMSAGLFWQTALAIYTQAICYSFLSQFWLALLPNLVISNVVNGVVASLWFIFGGIFIQPNKINSGWKWFYYMDPIQKSFVSAATIQFHCSGDDCPRVDVPSLGSQKVSDYVENILSSNSDYYWQWWGWLILTIAVIRIFTLIALHTISHIKR